MTDRAERLSRAERLAELRSAFETHGQLSYGNIEWLLFGFAAAQEEIGRLRGLLTLEPDEAITTTGEFGGVCVVKRDVWDRIEQERISLRAALAAAEARAAISVLAPMVTKQ